MVLTNMFVETPPDKQPSIVRYSIFVHETERIRNTDIFHYQMTPSE